MTRTVLLVDDEPNVLSGYIRALRRQPFNILTANDGEEAIEVLTNHEVDVIVSDECMPGMSGSALLAWAADNFPEIVRVLLTGFPSVDLALQAVNDGNVYRFLTKPCNDVDLAITVRKAIEFKDLKEKNRELFEQTREQIKYIESARNVAEEQARQLQVRTEELKLARNAAQDANAAKSAFLANMSHEIRTPMNAIMGFSRLLLKMPMPSDQREYIQYIYGAGDSLLHLINDILDFSKIEAGELQLSPVDFQLDELLREITAIGDSLIGERPLRIEARVEENVPCALRGDVHRLRQILTNLIGNAVKFTSQGAVLISASCYDRGHSHAGLRFEVTDTGIGIAANRQHAIFEDFTQADGSTTRKYGGTGLGLAICKRLTSLMGGKIGVDSELGAGSTFWFTVQLKTGLVDYSRAKPEQLVILPPGRSQNGDAAAEGSSTAIPTGDGSDTNRAVPKKPSDAVATDCIKVLIVDDEPLNRKLLMRLLASSGWELTEAADGAEALKKYHDGAFDLILLDVQLPEVDGLDVVRQIRSAEIGVERRTPVVALTAYALAGDRERCLDAGMDDYLAKPFKEDGFYEALLRNAPRQAHGAIERMRAMRQERRSAASNSVDATSKSANAQC